MWLERVDATANLSIITRTRNSLCTVAEVELLPQKNSSFQTSNKMKSSVQMDEFIVCKIEL